MKLQKILLPLVAISAHGAGVAAAAQISATPATSSSPSIPDPTPAAKLNPSHVTLLAPRQRTSSSTSSSTRPIRVATSTTTSTSSRRTTASSSRTTSTTSQRTTTTRTTRSSTRTSSTLTTRTTSRSTSTSTSTDDDDDTRTSTSTDSSTSTEPPSTTPTPTPPTITPPPPTKTPSGEGLNTSTGGLSPGAAAGITAGAVAGLAAIIAVVFLLWRKKQGGLRGALVTADYPSGMNMSPMNAGPSSGPRSGGGGATAGNETVPMEMGDGGVSQAGGQEGMMMQNGTGMGMRGGGKESFYTTSTEETPIAGNGYGTSPYVMPPASMMPPEPGYTQLVPPPASQQHLAPQRWESTVSRPVSDMTTNSTTGPTLNEPSLPVSPLSPPYYANTLPAPAPAAMGGGYQSPYQPPQPQRQYSAYTPQITLTHDQEQGEQAPRTSEEFSSSQPLPKTRHPIDLGNSPTIPTFLIPGGDRARALSFASVMSAGSSGGQGYGQRSAEVIGSGPNPGRAAMVPVAEEEPKPAQKRGGGGERDPQLQ